jgi:hypothetical protein
MKFLLLFFFCAAVLSARSQQVVDVSKTDYTVGQSTFFSAGGEPFVSVKFVSLVEGTPYFKDDFMQAVLVSKEGQAYRDISVKLDLFDNQLHYLDPKGKEYITTTPLREIVMANPASKDSFHFLYSSYLPDTKKELQPGWYLNLASGKATLYTFYKKTVQENKPYGASAIQQTIKTDNIFVVQTASGLTQLKKLKDLPGALPDKKGELEEFLKTRDDRRATIEQRFTAAINYYNSLP